jgi:predicted RNA-binding protein YlqC (UPF0109 family)
MKRASRGRLAKTCLWKQTGTRRFDVEKVEEPMKPLIMAIVQALVDKPDEVQIKEVIGEHAHVLELRVAKEDLGKVIGKGGAHASAIRTLMAATSGKEKKRYILEIIEY